MKVVHSLKGEDQSVEKKSKNILTIFLLVFSLKFEKTVKFMELKPLLPYQNIYT